MIPQILRQSLIVNNKYILKRYDNEVITIANIKSSSQIDTPIYCAPSEHKFNNMIVLRRAEQKNTIFIITAIHSLTQNLITVHELNLTTLHLQTFLEFSIDINPQLNNAYFCVFSMEMPHNKNNFILVLKEQFRPWQNRKINYLIYHFNEEEISLVKKINLDSPAYSSHNKWQVDHESFTTNPQFTVLFDNNPSKYPCFTRLEILSNKVALIIEKENEQKIVNLSFDNTLNILSACFIRGTLKDTPYIAVRIKQPSNNKITNIFYKIENEQFIPVGQINGFFNNYSFVVHPIKYNNIEKKYLFIQSAVPRNKHLLQIFELNNINDSSGHLIELGSNDIVSECVIGNHYYGINVYNDYKNYIKIYDLFSTKLMWSFEDAAGISNENLLIAEIYKKSYQNLQVNVELNSTILKKISGIENMPVNTLSLVSFFNNNKEVVLDKEEQLEFNYKNL